ncbi:MAG TPA: antibiotic biosynthesis monooxygenase [Syntrophales bacterium]|nr:antibiotic biosynthesis monooxygenase [Syntrophobacterales bacterium]HNQ01131.1 antibiotic biosynthesis monooxygenase [Syntrophales bacterium]HQL91165.1 antibiotic biosynthesis monooxygenase [Syntrophales bacterium]
MLVKVLIKRKVTQDKEAALLDLITQLRTLASRQPGYISGETLRSADNPEEYLVISTWQALDDWKRWFASKERTALQDQIDKILGRKTEYEVFQYPGKSVSLRSFKGYEGG